MGAFGYLGSVSVKSLKLNTTFKIAFIYQHFVSCSFFFFFPTKEMSHRTADFTKILNTAENLLRELL